jgi:serine/threonine-protein kinase
MTLAAGTVIGGRYVVQTLLGRGSFGEVYKVADGNQGGEYALKLFLPLPGTNVWHEAQILTQLESDYILPVRNADIASGVPYVVTDIAAYGTAADHLSPIGVVPDRAVHWTRAACRGTTRTHDAGLLHRDIKPGNLFLTATGDALLGDFGLAHLQDAFGNAPPGGTPVTEAPEVAAGNPATVRSDVYSLGATLYALLAGRYAHDGPDIPACLAALAAGPGPALRDIAPHVGQALAQRVARAMDRDPAARYASASAFDAALGQLPKQTRRWARTDEHPGHLGCWRGTAAKASAVTVCAIASGPHCGVEARYQPSGKKIIAACRAAAPLRLLSRNLRAAMNIIP